MESIKLLLFQVVIFLLTEITTYSQTPVYYPGFPKRLDSIRSSQGGGSIPLITDLDKDGQKEIIVGASDNNFTNRSMLYVIKSNGEYQTGFPKFISNWRIRAYASGDIDGNGYLEIAMRTDSLLYVFDRFGNNLPGFPVSANLVTSYFAAYFVQLYDLDNDGKLELITNNTNGLTVFNYNGTTRAGWPVNFGASIPRYAAIGDLDNDGFGEIVLTSVKLLSPGIDSSHIRIYKHNGQVFNNNWPAEIDSQYHSFFGGPSLYINPQNPQENYIMIPSAVSINWASRYRITKYDINGNILIRKNYSGMEQIGTISIGDIDRDNVLNYFCGSQNPEDLMGFDGSLNKMAGFPLTVGRGAPFDTPVIGKLSYNNNLNILVTGTRYDPNTNAGLWGAKPDGSYLSWSPLKANGYERRFIGFSLADLNNDGSVEIIGTVDSNWNAQTFHLYIWTLPGIPYTNNDFPWPQYGHDRYRTFQYGFIPPDEPIGIQPISNSIPEEFQLYQNFPNPFNPNSKIKFQIAKLSGVKLVVFDVLGREVSTLVDEQLKPGTYEINFDGSNLSSGVYYYKLIADEYTETKRMALIK